MLNYEGKKKFVEKVAENYNLTSEEKENLLFALGSTPIKDNEILQIRETNKILNGKPLREIIAVDKNNKNNIAHIEFF